MKLLGLMLTAVLIFCSSYASAEVAVMGLGVSSCAKFASDYKSNPDLFENFYFSWAQGYMSGLNFALIGKGELTVDLSSKTIGEQQRNVRAYCNDHPLANYGDAVMVLFLTLPKSPASPNSN